MLELFKFCPKCQQEKPSTEFYKSSFTKDGLGGYCKQCAKTSSIKSYHTNPSCKRRVNEYQKKHHIRLRDMAKENARHQPWVRIVRSLYTQLKKHTKYPSKIGLKPKQLKIHLESLFTKGTSWESYGVKWSIGHIKQRAKFDFSKPEEVAKFNHYTNLCLQSLPYPKKTV